MGTLITEAPEAAISAPATPRVRSVAWVAIPILLFVLAAGLRLWDLGRPNELIGDETYYALDAYAYLGGTPPFPGTPAGAISGERSWVHPPLGKDLIALAEGPLGFHAWAWRLPSALAGIAGVMLVYLIALRLWGSPWWAGLAGGFVALDGLHIVQSRLAMLDILAGTFAVAGVYFLVRDRTGGARTERAPGRLRRGFDRRLVRWFGTPSRCWAGVLFGAAVATKWTGVPFLVLGAAITASWIRRDLVGEARMRTLLGSFLLAPAAVYLMAYAPFWAQHGPDLGGFLHLQATMLGYHLRYDHPQPNASSPLSWPLLTHPIRYFPTSVGTPGRSGPAILALGNPAVWWGAFVAVPFVAWLGRRRDAWGERLVLAAFAVAYLPWMLVSRQTFLYYMTAAVPFMGLTLTAGLHGLPQRIRPAVAWATAAAAAGIAVLLSPLWFAWHVGEGWDRWMHWFAGWR